MIRVYAALMVFVCLLAQNAAAQEPRPDRTVILDISIIEITAARAEDMETIVRDRLRLSSLINEGKAKTVASVQMRARAGESASAQIGHRVPIQTASLPALGRSRADSSRADSSDASGAGVAVPQVQYENIGLNVVASPRVVAGEQVEVRLKVEQTAIERSTGTLTPTFIQRSFNDYVKVRTGEPALLLGVVQNQSGLMGTARQSDTTVGSFAVLMTARVLD
jgi:type II secretory pathway component HofQ